jgi:orotate phosphoribosyltransferase
MISSTAADLVADAMFPALRMTRGNESFMLSGGKETRYRFDLNGDSGVWCKNITALTFLKDALSTCTAFSFTFSQVAGVPTGGNWWALWVAGHCFERTSREGGVLTSEKQIAVYSKLPKNGGNGNANNNKVVLIDDVATTGASLIDLAHLLQAEGKKVVGAAALLYREQGATARLARENIPFLYLTTGEQALVRYLDTGRISTKQFIRLTSDTSPVLQKKENKN